MKGFGLLIIFLVTIFYIGNKFLPESKKIQVLNDRKNYLLAISLGFLLILVGMSFFYADPGKQYFIVSPFGNKSVVTSEGYKFIFPLSKVQEWQKYIDVKVLYDEIEDKAIDEIEGKMQPINIRFIDQVTANGYVSTRFKLPQDPQSFIELAIKFRSMDNLVSNTLIPTVREQLVNTGYMFAAQDYISGDAQQFRQTFEEQLKYGTYVVEKQVINDTIWEDIQTNQPRKIKEIKTKYIVNKVIENGKPKRIPHEITENNITVSQVIVDKIDLEETFKKRLEAQRDESAKRQLEQQKIETAKASQMRILAEGERDKSAERVKQEKEQVKTLIAIETEKKKEKTKMELARIALETEKLNAQAKKVAADAESYKNKKLVQAGLTPQERAEWEYKTSVGVAEKLAGPQGLQLPQTYIKSGGSTNGKKSATDDLLMMLLMQTMNNSNKKQ
jgi:hypothetical protein